jgi:nifR3 family TIM-barrel protein
MDNLAPMNARGRPRNQERIPGMVPLAFDNLHIGFPVVQAALSGYSDWPMRLVARRLGAPYTCCEVMLDKFVVDVSKGKKARRYLIVTDDEHPVGGQLMGARPEDFGPAAERLVQAGFDVIDINFGCPVKKVLGRCRGGFHLSQPDVALEIVSRVRDVVPHEMPVTVKMRIGIDDSDASREKFFTILDGAFQRGVAAVTVHGRTVLQRYEGPSRWELLREVKRHAGQRVILGSGDLFTPQACLEMIATTGVDGVTVARGAIGNPWIFRQAQAIARGEPIPPPPSLHEQRDVIRMHYQLADQVYGPKRCCQVMRKFGIKYSRLHPQATKVRDAFVQVRQPGDWQRVLETWYAEDRPGVYPQSADHSSCTPGCESTANTASAE